MESRHPSTNLRHLLISSMRPSENANSRFLPLFGPQKNKNIRTADDCIRPQVNLAQCSVLHSGPSPRLLCHTVPQAKLAVYLTRKKALAGRAPGDGGAAFMSLVHPHLWAELHWAASMGSLDSFKGQWVLPGVPCSVLEAYDLAPLVSL